MFIFGVPDTSVRNKVHLNIGDDAIYMANIRVEY